MHSLRRKANIWADYYFRTLRWLSVIAGFAILAMMLYVVLDIGGRYLANQPIPAGLEITKTLMIFIVFMGVAYTFARGGHLSLEFIHQRLHPRGQAILDIFSLLITLSLLLLLGWKAWGWALKGWELKTLFEGTYGVPIYPARFTVAVGAFLFSIQAVIELIRRASQLPGIGQMKEQK